jgi:hypothetical protein
MTEEHKSETNNIKDEFQALGENFKSLFTSAWESEERKKLQSELEAGMRELGVTLNDLAEEIRTSQAGETIRREATDFHERVKSGEVETKAREEIVKALKALNSELEKVSEKFATNPAEDDSSKV